jgi:serine protease Do
MSVTGFGEVAEQLRRATVLIESRKRGHGSGIVWSSEGTIITNAHVVGGPHTRVQLWDGREFRARVASRDARRDLAALHIEASALPAAAIADSSALRPGQLAIAIGNPLGFLGALTTGVIHAVGPIPAMGSATWVQAGVRLAPGNSGGPLADARGRVIGVNTMVAGRLALAVPSNAVRDFLLGEVPQGWLGVSVRPIRLPPEGGSGQRGAFGLLLVEVEEQSPAALASLLAGDILLGTEQRAFTSIGDLSLALEGKGPRVLRLEFLRGDYRNLRRVTVALGGNVSAGNGMAA